MNKSRKQRKFERIKAFETIVAEYEQPLLRYATRLLHNTDAAQDIVQDAFIRLFRTWGDDFLPSTQISVWLYRVAHNCAVDHIRRTARIEQLHSRHAEELPLFAPPDRGDGFQISEAAEHAANALDILNSRERQLVILKVYEEKSYKEIGEITGLSVSNVGYILHHAMRKLADELKKARSI